MPDASHLLTPTEAAAELGVTAQRVHALMTSGRLDSLPADAERGRRITRAAVQDYAERRRREAANRLADAERRQQAAATRRAQLDARLAKLNAAAEAIR